MSLLTFSSSVSINNNNSIDDFSDDVSTILEEESGMEHPKCKTCTTIHNSKVCYRDSVSVGDKDTGFVLDTFDSGSYSDTASNFVPLEEKTDDDKSVIISLKGEIGKIDIGQNVEANKLLCLYWRRFHWKLL